MPVYHIVLFKLKPDATAEKVSALKAEATGMVGQVPGLVRLDFNAPLESTAHRSQGFNAGLVAVLEKSSDVQVYADHPAHQKLHKLRESLCSDTLAYDLEY